MRGEMKIKSLLLNNAFFGLVLFVFGVLLTQQVLMIFQLNNTVNNWTVENATVTGISTHVLTSENLQIWFYPDIGREYTAVSYNYSFGTLQYNGASDIFNNHEFKDKGIRILVNPSSPEESVAGQSASYRLGRISLSFSILLALFIILLYALFFN